MKHLWMFIFIFVGIVILLGVAGGGIYFYFMYLDKQVYGDLINMNSGTTCNLSGDDYAKPDFNQVKTLIEKEQMIQDLPEDGSLSVVFYHVFNGCKVYDKIYRITKGKVEERNMKGDIDINMPSDYAKKISNGICPVIIEANNNQELGKTVNVNTAKLLVKYSGMLKYKDCLGL